MSTFAMNNQKFDVVEYIKKLRNAKFTQEQAETIAQETEHFLDGVLERTKQESKELFNNSDLSTKGDIRESDLRMDKKIAALESRLIIWVLGTGVGAVVTILSGMVTLLKYLH